MAFYIVTVDGKRYANPHLCRAANKIGDAGLLREIVRGTLVQKQVLDNVLYLIDEAQAHKYSAVDAMQQNIDSALHAFNPLNPAEKGVTTTVIAKDANVAVYTYKKHRFVKLSDLADANKYRHQSRMAILTVCGCAYVALDAVLKSEKEPIIVTIEQ